MTEPILKVRNLGVTFPTDDGPVRAVQEMSFDVEPGEVLAVVGESGSGKTVTAMSIMGLHPKGTQVTGSINLLGDELVGMKPKELRHRRGREVAMIFQDPMTAMNPVFTVGAQISEAIRIHNPSVSKDQGLKRAAELLEAVGVPEPDRRTRQYPHEFSGGMRQRAMIAMAIANQPRLLVADEPTTALDVTIQAQVIEVMQEAQALTGAAMMLITHDLGLVAGLADRIQVMYAGRVVETGSTDDIFYRSRNPYTRGLMASIPRVDSRGDERLKPIPGTPPSLLNPPSGCAFRPRCEFSTDVCTDTVPSLTTIGPNHESRCHEAHDLPALGSQS